MTTEHPPPRNWRRAWPLATAVLLPALLPLLFGNVAARPRLAAEPTRSHTLASPWDQVRFEGYAPGTAPPVALATSVDPRAFESSPNDRELLRPALVGLARLARASDVAVLGGDANAADEVLAILDHYARAKAFGCSPRDTEDLATYLANPWIDPATGEPWMIPAPEPVRSWSDRAILSCSYGEAFFLGKVATCCAVTFLQVRGAAAPDDPRVPRIQRWLSETLLVPQREFATMLFQSRRTTRHTGEPLPEKRMMLWGWQGVHNKAFLSTLAVMAIAIATGDRDQLAWSLEALEVGLGGIAEDGTHPVTLYEKAELALLYHNFLLELIVPAALLATCNGRDVIHDPRLARLARRFAQGAANPATFEAAAGRQQVYGWTNLAGQASWAVSYRHYATDEAVRRIGSPARWYYHVLEGPGRVFGGNPILWQPARIDPWAEWAGRAWFYLRSECLLLCLALLAACLRRRPGALRRAALWSQAGLLVLGVLWGVVILRVMI